MNDTKKRRVFAGVTFRTAQLGGTTRSVATVSCACKDCTQIHEVMHRSDNHPPDFFVRLLGKHGWTFHKGRYYCPQHKD